MKKLVLYTTVDGNTEAVAMKIAEKIGADTAGLVRCSKVKAFGFFNNLKLRFEVMFKRKPDIFPFKWDPRDYDVIFIGTPVWYDSYNPVYNTLFNVIKVYDRKVALFSTGMKEDSTALSKMIKSWLTDSVVLDTKHCVEPIFQEDDAECERILEDMAQWAEGICETAEKMIEQEEFERRKTIYKY